MSNSASQPLDCILDDPELDIIPENHHYVNQCLCSMCSCGKHICPSLRSSAYPRSTFASIYNESFKRTKSPSPPKKIVPIEVKVSSRCIDWQPSSRLDYTNPGLAKTQAVIQPRTLNTANTLKFVSSSVYKSDFNNWGSCSAEKIKPVLITHAFADVKLSSQTTYKDEFQRTVTPPPRLSTVAKSTSLQRILGLKSAPYEITTTHRAEFKPQEPIEETRQLIRRRSFVAQNASPGQYKTSSRAQYTVQRIKKNPILIKKSAVSKY
jgi:hypothetical protein